jgi:beta-lactamase class A
MGRVYPGCKRQVEWGARATEEPLVKNGLLLVLASAGLLVLAGFAVIQGEGARDVQAASAAANLNLVLETCLPDGTVALTVDWAPSDGDVQWVDLSLFDNGFAPGTFLNAGPLQGMASSFTWDGLLPGERHFLRVNTLSAQAWFPSATLSFITRGDCPGAPPRGIAAVEAAQPAPDMLALQEAIAAQIVRSGFDTAVAVTDLQTGETISFQGDALRLSGCTINFFVLLQVYVDLQSGHLEEPAVRALISRTVLTSNPVPARELLVVLGAGDIYVGMERVNSLMMSLGMEASLYDHPPAYPESLFGLPNLLTAVEMNRALEAVWRTDLLTPEWRSHFLDALTRSSAGIRYLVPAGVRGGVVSHKIGFFWETTGWVDNDAGIVRFQRGGETYAYAISIFSERVPRQYADVPLAQRISAMTWEFFSNRYPTTAGTASN